MGKWPEKSTVWAGTLFFSTAVFAGFLAACRGEEYSGDSRGKSKIFVHIYYFGFGE